MVSQESGFRATGRRKTAVATVFIVSGTGKFEVNGRPMEDYFNREELRLLVTQPLVITESLLKYDIKARVNGGGMVGQAGAMRHSLSRALAEVDDRLRHTLKQAGLLTRDQRMRERKKYGQPGARKRFQFSKR
jgi:small subunit ribosomal protein S9